MRTEREVAEYFGKQLETARRMASLTREQLGDLLGCSKSHIYRMERDHLLPSKRVLDTMCDLFNRKVEIFFPDGVPKLSVKEDPRLGIPHKEYKPKKPKYSPEELNINLDVESEVAIDKDLPTQELKPQPMPESTEFEPNNAQNDTYVVPQTTINDSLPTVINEQPINNAPQLKDVQPIKDVMEQVPKMLEQIADKGKKIVIEIKITVE